MPKSIGEKHELSDGTTVYLADRWLTGECRSDNPTECSELARFGNDWVACAGDTHVNGNVESRLERLEAMIDRVREQEGGEVARGTGVVKAPRPCMCGCGEITKGGRFLPGHDARLKSQLLTEAREGNEGAVQRLEELGWGHFL